jgi:hypothetical protein
MEYVFSLYLIIVNNPAALLLTQTTWEYALAGGRVQSGSIALLRG